MISQRAVMYGATLMPVGWEDLLADNGVVSMQTGVVRRLYFVLQNCHQRYLLMISLNEFNFPTALIAARQQTEP